MDDPPPYSDIPNQPESTEINYGVYEQRVTWWFTTLFESLQKPHDDSTWNEEYVRMFRSFYDSQIKHTFCLFKFGYNEFLARMWTRPQKQSEYRILTSGATTDCPDYPFVMFRNIHQTIHNHRSLYYGMKLVMEKMILEDIISDQREYYIIITLEPHDHYSMMPIALDTSITEENIMMETAGISQPSVLSELSNQQIQPKPKVKSRSCVIQ